VPPALAESPAEEKEAVMSSKSKAKADSPQKSERTYQGIFSRVAKQLGLSRTNVYSVAIGERESERVRRALLAEFARIGRLAA
jgi:hypothetical protein